MSAGPRILLTDEEKAIVERLGHNLYTVDFLEEWINRNDNVYANAPAALQECTAYGFYQAIKAMAQNNVVGHELFGEGQHENKNL